MFFSAQSVLTRTSERAMRFLPRWVTAAGGDRLGDSRSFDAKIVVRKCVTDFLCIRAGARGSGVSRGGRAPRRAGGAPGTGIVAPLDAADPGPGQIIRHRVGPRCCAWTGAGAPAAAAERACAGGSENMVRSAPRLLWRPRGAAADTGVCAGSAPDRLGRASLAGGWRPAGEGSRTVCPVRGAVTVGSDLRRARRSATGTATAPEAAQVHCAASGEHHSLMARLHDDEVTVPRPRSATR